MASFWKIVLFNNPLPQQLPPYGHLWLPKNKKTLFAESLQLFFLCGTLRPVAAHPGAADHRRLHHDQNKNRLIRIKKTG